MAHTPCLHSQGSLAPGTPSSPAVPPSRDSVFQLHSPRSASPFDEGVEQRQLQADIFTDHFLVWRETFLHLL